MTIPELTQKMLNERENHWLKLRHDALVDWPGGRTEEQEHELQKLKEWMGANEA